MLFKKHISDEVNPINRQGVCKGLHTVHLGRPVHPSLVTKTILFSEGCHVGKTARFKSNRPTSFGGYKLVSSDKGNFNSKKLKSPKS